MLSAEEVALLQANFISSGFTAPLSARPLPPINSSNTFSRDDYVSDEDAERLSTIENNSLHNDRTARRPTEPSSNSSSNVSTRKHLIFDFDESWENATPPQKENPAVYAVDPLQAQFTPGQPVHILNMRPYTEDSIKGILNSGDVRDPIERTPFTQEDVLTIPWEAFEELAKEAVDAEDDDALDADDSVVATTTPPAIPSTIPSPIGPLSTDPSRLAFLRFAPDLNAQNPKCEISLDKIEGAVAVVNVNGEAHVYDAQTLAKVSQGKILENSDTGERGIEAPGTNFFVTNKDITVLDKPTFTATLSAIKNQPAPTNNEVQQPLSAASQFKAEEFDDVQIQSSILESIYGASKPKPSSLSEKELETIFSSKVSDELRNNALTSLSSISDQEERQFPGLRSTIVESLVTYTNKFHADVRNSLVPSQPAQLVNPEVDVADDEEQAAHEDNSSRAITVSS